MYLVQGVCFTVLHRTKQGLGMDCVRGHGFVVARRQQKTAAPRKTFMHWASADTFRPGLSVLDAGLPRKVGCQMSHNAQTYRSSQRWTCLFPDQVVPVLALWEVPISDTYFCCRAPRRSVRSARSGLRPATLTSPSWAAATALVSLSPRPPYLPCDVAGSPQANTPLPWSFWWGKRRQQHIQLGGAPLLQSKTRIQC